MDRLGRRKRRVDVLVDEEAPHVLERVHTDEVLDVDPAIAKRTAVPVRLCDLGLEGNDTFEAGTELSIGRGHLRERYRKAVRGGSSYGAVTNAERNARAVGVSS